MISAFAPKILSFITGFDLSKLKPLIPFAAAFVAGWVIQGYRLGEKEIKAQIKAKDDFIASQNIQIETERALVALRDDKIQNLKDERDKSDGRIQDLEGRVTELIARTPKDTTTIIDRTEDKVDDLINKDGSLVWLRYPYPDSMLDDTNRAIRESKEYGNPLPALAGDRTDWPNP